MPTAPGSPVSVAQLCDLYLAWACTYYRLSRTPANLRCALAPLRKLWGLTPAAEFNAKRLRLLQQEMATSGGCGRLSRRSVNDYLQWVKAMFRWAAQYEEAGVDELLPHRLSLVRPLIRGRSAARESAGVHPVDWHDVAATVLYCPRKLAAMIETQWWSGMRPGELVRLRRSEMTTPDAPACWTYIPGQHKTAWRGKTRTILLGPLAQRVLTDWIKGLPAAQDELWPMRALSYYRAIQRVNTRHQLRGWAPNQIRHSAATRIRAALGLETARMVLGHSAASTTAIYAEQDLAGAAAAMAKIG